MGLLLEDSYSNIELGGSLGMTLWSCWVSDVIVMVLVVLVPPRFCMLGMMHAA